MLGTERIDVAVLDVMMPGPSGLSLCRTPAPGRRLHRAGDPADRTELRRTIGSRGWKPAPTTTDQTLSPRELALRVRSVLPLPHHPSTVPLEITVGQLSVSTAARSVTVAGTPGRPDQPGVRPAVVLPSPTPTPSSPARSCSNGSELGLRRPLHGHRARQAVTVQTRRPPPRPDRVGPGATLWQGDPAAIPVP